MGKINGSRVFLGGLLAGIVMFILGSASFVMYLGKLYEAALQALGRPLTATAGMYVLAFIMSLIGGILAVWLYAAIRPRFGAGAKTAIIAGFFIWVIGSLFPSISMGTMGFFPTNLLVIDGISGLVIYIVATLLGAWVYKEQSQ